MSGRGRGVRLRIPPRQPGRRGPLPFALLAAIFAAALPVLHSRAGSAPPVSPRGKTGQLRVLASFLPIYVFAQNVARDVPGVSVETMLPPDLGCPHGYALSPGDLRKIAEADVYLANGHGMEHFLGTPVREANPGIPVVETAAEVSPIPAGGAEKEHGVNPHTWVSPGNAALQVRAIGRALSAALPERADAFRRNAEEYSGRLAGLEREFRDAARSFRHREIVTHHDAFDYLARDLGLAVVGRIRGEAGEEPSAREIARLARIIREHQVPAVFTEPQYPGKIAAAVAREAGVPVRILDPFVTGSPSPSGYEEAMRKNLAVLREALGGS